MVTGPVVPLGMRRVYGRFERWRKSYQRPMRIPEPLWASAVKLAREHGVCRTAQVLHLEYRKLKRLVESTSSIPHRTAAPPSFVELVAPPARGLSECLIDLEGPRGKMRIQWKGATSPDLAGLSRALWERS